MCVCPLRVLREVLLRSLSDHSLTHQILPPPRAEGVRVHARLPLRHPRRRRRQDRRCRRQARRIFRLWIRSRTCLSVFQCGVFIGLLFTNLWDRRLAASRSATSSWSPSPPTYAQPTLNNDTKISNATHPFYAALTPCMRRATSKRRRLTAPVTSVSAASSLVSPTPSRYAATRLLLRVSAVYYEFLVCCVVCRKALSV